MGGPMDVFDYHMHAWMEDEISWVKEFIALDKPVLGICLGAQLIAQAAGGRVYKADEKEFGWYPVELTEDGEGDVLFQGFPRSYEVFQWHEDTFSIPLQGKQLVTATGCPNQGFKVGKGAYGIQFHLEADTGMMNGWVASETDAANVSSLTVIQRETSEKSTDCVKWGKKLLVNFLALAEEI